MATSREAAAFVPILQRFGVPRDGVLIVHSAIATLSRRGFRAEAIIDALIDHMRDGNLFMPTMTWRTVTLENPDWDELETPSHTGVLTEIFRTRYASARSIHPTHSVAGLGPAARALLSRHHVDNTPVSGNSPYGLHARLRDLHPDDRGGSRSLHGDPSAGGDDQRGSLRSPRRDCRRSIHAAIAMGPCIRSGRGGTGGLTAISISSRPPLMAKGQLDGGNDRRLSLCDRVAARSAASRVCRSDRQPARHAERQGQKASYSCP